eukprot:CAMPEP_0169176086 /NCGR_PEP_ID=MMETSP1015-20121227/65642_1 /TAXON_ID=342587 /ORGANISM="Karlodinium micrum, Strain CCMP2283" /LENGTH=405 /DNA_ID=CAMNT_0009250489 /DNA_START=30 /DNA_END=1247 /DNA_ORIENTATION=+
MTRTRASTSRMPRTLGGKISMHRKLEKLDSIVRGLNGQVASLVRRCCQLHEETDVLRESLVAAGALQPTSLLACLHRRRFAEVIKQYPSPWPGCLNTIMQNRELALCVAMFTGAESIKPLAVASPALRHGVGAFLAEHASLFPAQLYVVGGADDTGSAVRSVDRFDSYTSAWKPVGSLLEARESCAVVVANAVVYAIGGASGIGNFLATVECFNPRTGEWAPQNVFQSLDSVERYSSRTRTWQMMPPLRSPRFGAAATILGDCIFLLGGKTGRHCLNVVEAFRLNEGSWEPMPSMLACRYRAAAATACGQVYSVGGCDDAWQTGLHSVECFDPESSSWHIVAPLNTPRWGASAVATSGYIFIIGGRDSGSALDSVERFDPHAGVWVLRPPLTNPRKFCGAVACHD